MDTTVLIDIHRGKPGIKKKLLEIPTNTLSISEISVQELYTGLGYSKEILGESVYLQQKARIDDIIKDFNIIPISRTILEFAGLKEGCLKAKGIIIDFQDLIIGITAELINAEIILTRNPTHFKECSIPKEIYSI